MRLSIVQSQLHWQDAAANRRMFTQKLAPLAGQTELVVLPEMFNTGFSMATEALAEPMNGPTVEWMLNSAAALNAALAGSFICLEADKFYNRLVFAQPDGSLEWYDKRHLFALAGEDRHFETNNKKLVLAWKGFRIRPLICYDLRFPVWSRNEAANPYDLLLYVANWPNRRALHWQSLLRARAIENQSFVAGVNIVGVDGAGLEYAGDSSVIDFSGQELVRISGTEGIVTVSLNREDLVQYRSQLPFLSDADTFYLAD